MLLLFLLDMKLSKLYKDFLENEKKTGFILIACTIISLLIANSIYGTTYTNLWHYQFNGHSITHWINDGLMTIFFLLIGLELEREIYVGELSNLKNALLPIFAAIGGMLVPAGLYLLLNYNTTTQSGAGIPMATDIAFAIGILSLLGNKVPITVKIFLTALAIIDDLGAIFTIAIFYTDNLNWQSLSIALAIFIGLLILNRLKIRNLIPYLFGGIFMWYFMLSSGVHATITGVLLAFAIPFGNGDSKSTSYLLQHALHRPVGFIILPLFALCNTAIVIQPNWQENLISNSTLGIALGLIVGKPIGITLFSYLSVYFKISKLPYDLNWKKIIAVSCLGGIGFTMSIFVTLLAFDSPLYIDNAKLMIIISSLIAAIIGLFSLKKVL